MMNMDVNKVYIVDFKDMKSPAKDTTIFAEIVLIDRTHPAVQPLLYQLNSDSPSHDISHFQNHLISLTRDAFQEVGPVDSIDRKHKQILLANKNTVNYKYLIIASGNNNTLSSGLQTLIDALKVKSLPAFDHFEKDGVLVENPKATIYTVGHEIANQIEKIANNKLLETLVRAQGNELSPHNKIYEVQL